MDEAHNDLAGLAQLHRLDSIDQVRALWRRGMATLAAVASDHRPVPLEGFSPSALLAGARLALSRGFFDDLGWLSPAAAAVAMFELASALPRGDERRDLGRRVLTALHQGDAETFVAVATSLALGSRRGLENEHERARVALAMYMPLGMGTRADALALALISRRDSEREWLSLPSIGSLPSRRLAARLLERAARETARRAAAGDHAGVHIFNTPSVSQAFHRLLADRESLVWRHVAAARGLLSNAVPAYISVIEHNLSAELTPTEWRRAAASLTARIAIEPEEAMSRCNQLLFSDIATRDPGVIGSMIYGLPCAAETEITAAEEFLDQLTEVGDVYAIEALVDLRRERIGEEFGVRAALRARARLRDLGRDADDGMFALREALYDELAPPGHRQGCPLQDSLIAAVEGFAERGTSGTAEATARALSTAEDTILKLERAWADTTVDRMVGFRALRELDRGLLETHTLHDLLTLQKSGEEGLVSLERIRARLTRWLLTREFDTVSEPDIAHITNRLRRLRTLLHLVDADGAYADSGNLRDRRLSALNLLLRRVSGDVESPVRRTVCAALARCCDAAVREQSLELSDVFLASTLSVPASVDLSVLGEASMEPSFKQLMREYVELMRTIEIARREDTEDEIATCLEAFRALGDAVPTARTARVEALRSALRCIENALRGIRKQPSLTRMVEKMSHVSDLEANVQWLAQLVMGVGQRLESVRRANAPRSGLAVRGLDAAIERAARGERKGLALAVTSAVEIIRDELPSALADVIAMVLWQMARLPQESDEPEDDASEHIALKNKPRMVPWLPPGRVLGGFYILRTIGKGAVGSVFVARRVEERHQDTAESFALKVPEYHGAAAHTLSESEFMQLFREEARALLSLPEHPNLAHFVTFDARARPKPILVMELVPGPTLERTLDRDEFTMYSALNILDGIAAGLGAMHSVGVAHLDVKPSNIILRESQSQPGLVDPVLVDFGLAGRKIRPGCATVHYGAPEVWTTRPIDDLPPMPTDVYAFACLAFELLTNMILFDGETAVSIVSAHMRHKGKPALLEELRRDERFGELADVLALGLSPGLTERCTIGTIQQGLLDIAPALCKHEWPIGFD